MILILSFLMLLPSCTSPEDKSIDQKALENSFKLCEFSYKTDPQRALTPCSESADLADTLGLRDKQVSALLMLGHIRYRLNQIDESLKVYTTARELALEADLPDLAALCSWEIGNLYYFCYGNLDAAAESYLDALAQARSIGDIPKEVIYLNNVVVVRAAQGRHSEAAELLCRALDIGRDHLSQYQYATLKINLGATYSELGDFDRAWELLLEAEDTFLENGSPSGLARVDLHRGEILEKEGRLSEAEESYRLALSAYTQLEHPGRVAYVLRTLGSLETQRKRFPEAMEYLEQALAETIKTGNRIDQVKTMISIARVHLDSGDFGKAESTLEEVLSLCQNNGIEVLLSSVYEMLSELDERNGRLAEALAWRTQADRLKNQKVADSGKAVVKTVLDYERAEREELLKKERQTFIFWWTGSGLVTAGIATLLFFRIRQHRRYQRLAEMTAERQSAVLAWQQEQLESLVARIGRVSESVDSRYRSSPLTKDKIHELLPKLIELVEEQQLYFDPDLTLATMADRLQVNRSYLSQVVNEHLGQTFTNYINGLRVKEAAERLSDTNNQAASVLEICFDVGFNSKSAFYNAFKQHTGSTPIQYRQSKAQG